MIRILHTSDWHLGLELGGFDRLEEQKRFLDWLVGQCAEQAIDALLVSGDVYDVVNPSMAAQSIFAEFVVRFRRELPNASLVVVAGNHDSGARLELPRPFAEALGNLHLVGSVASPEARLAKHLLPLRDRQGNPIAWCLAVPFLRAGDIDCKLLEGETVDQAFSRSVAEFYRTLQAEATARDATLPVVAMGHLTLAGSDKAGSERILIGGVESVAVTALSQGSDYVALGHIHRCQTVGSPVVRYCGSPLAMDFDERRHPHRVLVVDLSDRTGPVDVRAIDVPVWVPLLRFPQTAGSWSELVRAVEDFDWEPWREVGAGLWPLVDLQFVPDGSEADLRERTENLCRGRPFRLVGAPRRVGGIRPVDEERLVGSCDLRSGDAPRDLFVRHWMGKHGAPPPDDMLDCFAEIVDRLAIERGRS